MYTTKMAHEDLVNAACGETVQLGGLLPALNYSGHSSSIFGNMLIYVHVNSPVYYTCKAGHIS